MTGLSDALKPPRFSIVSAVYNVDRYLPEFFSSLESQTFGINNLDIVLVDDGSLDSSLSSCQEFAAKYPGSVRVLTKPNGGQGSARNLGLDHVRGEWVTFTDPDDFLDARYFEEIASSLESSPSSARVLATSLVTYKEKSGKAESSHPLQHKFAAGNRVIDLDAEPECIQMHCSSAVIDAALIRENSLRFDGRIRPTFEDAHFVGSCLLAAQNSMLGVVATARYFYRKRADATSTIDVSVANPDKYTVVPRFGLLGLLNSALATYGQAPAWVQNMVLYDLCWAFKDDAAVASKTGSLPTVVTEEFHELASEVLSHIDESLIQQFSLLGLSDDLRFVLAQGYRSNSSHSGSLRLHDVDTAKSLVKLSYRYRGDAPDELILVDGVPVLPAAAKSRSIEFFGRTVSFERVLWVQFGKEVSVALNGRAASFLDRIGEVTQTLTLPTVEQTARDRLHSIPEPFRHPERSFSDRLRERARLLPKALTKPAVFEAVLSLALHSRWIRSRFGSAWVFMDKDVLAGDNAEHLYRYTREHHPEVNAWFVLSKASPDWKRLRLEGFRLVAYGSWRWQLLLLSADHLASSHVDNYVVQPLSRKRFGPPRWRFTFLQHGVIQSDLSRWLNTKKIDLFVTSSIYEHESIVGDGTPYLFTTKETKLLGLPRHDALRSKRASTPPDERDLLVIMPTWRKNLLGQSQNMANNRAAISNFSETEYARQYTRLLGSERLRSIADAHNMELAFMPHPNMADYLDEFEVPAHVKVFTYERDDVQQVLARTRIMVTDYSSVAFDAAAIDSPVIYFQFDSEEFHAGGHIARSGYFDYKRDGFGPVCQTVDDVESAAAQLVGLGTPSAYVDRARQTFAHHDRSNSERVFHAMRALDASTVDRHNLDRFGPR